MAGFFIGMRPDPLITQGAPSPGNADICGRYVSILRRSIPENSGCMSFRCWHPTIPGLLGGLPAGPPALRELNPYVKSIKAGGVDVLDTGVTLAPGMDTVNLEIMLGPMRVPINGRVLNAQKHPADGAVCRTDSRDSLGTRLSHGYVQIDVERSHGRFQLQGLPPGEYKVFAWDDIDKNALVDLDFMRQFESLGTTVRVNEGDKPTLEVALIPVAGS